jgi:hypothetical protein
VATTRKPVVDPENLHPRVTQSFDRLLSVHRPFVLAHIRSIRNRRPHATPAEVIVSLERRFLTATTTGGAAVGATAVIPAVGAGTSLALSAVETAGFLEATALFAQSVAEVHGIPLDDPERARTLVMGMMLGNSGQDLLTQVAAQAGGRGSRTAYWGEFVTKNSPGPVFTLVAQRVRDAFIKRFAVRQGASVLGRMIPFGIGAVIGGTGNHLMGRKIISSSREAFGPAPAEFPTSLDDVIKLPSIPRPPMPRLPRRRGSSRALPPHQPPPPPHELDRLPD